MKKLIPVKFTLEELKQIESAIVNCYGHGDWLEFLDINTNSKKEANAFYDGWRKINKAYIENIKTTA